MPFRVGKIASIAKLCAAMMRTGGRVPHDGFQGWCRNPSESYRNSAVHRYGSVLTQPLRQEAHGAPEIGGPMPGFAKAFLPIGSQYVTVQLGDNTDTPIDGGWRFKGTIEQDGKTPVDRNFFLRPDFQHIHAVAYTPLHFGEPISPIKECAVLHNPMARPEKAVLLGMGHEYAVEIGDGEFSIRPLKSAS